MRGGACAASGAVPAARSPLSPPALLSAQLGGLAEKRGAIYGLLAGVDRRSLRAPGRPHHFGERVEEAGRPINARVLAALSRDTALISWPAGCCCCHAVVVHRCNGLGVAALLQWPSPVYRCCCRRSGHGCRRRWWRRRVGYIARFQRRPSRRREEGGEPVLDALVTRRRSRSSPV